MAAPPRFDSTSDPTGRPASGWANYRRLLAYVRPYWVIFIGAILGFLLSSAAEAYFVTLFGDLIDAWGAVTGSAIYKIPLLMVGVALVRLTGEIVGELLLNQISFSVVHKIRTQLFDHLMALPSSYFDASSHGHLVSRITFNVAQLRDTATDVLKSIVQDGGKVIVYLVVMLFLSWKLTLVFVVAAPLVAIVVIYAARRFRRISHRIQDSMADVTHVASETVLGNREVKTFGGEAYERERFGRASRSNRRQNLKMVVTKVCSTQIIQVFVAVALALLMIMLFQPGLGGTMSAGQVVTFLGLAGMLSRPIRKLSEVNARLQRGLVAAADVFGQLDEQTELDEGERDVERAEGHIEFRDVSFGYRQDGDHVLHHVDLDIKAGQTVALVGRSGSGKTTIANLIPRFYEPESGEILLDGVPLDSYQLPALRRQIAVVSQQITLFNDTLERNIAYGDLAGADPDALAAAIRRAHADVFIDELPDGTRTVVGDDGVLLSGGERQRVAIARALLKDAPVLILDEATSALDSESERYIQGALEAVMQGRTTLVIAHRLSTVENADLIAVLDGGRIVELGDHASLLAKDGVYTALYDAQFEDTSQAGIPADALMALPAKGLSLPTKQTDLPPDPPPLELPQSDVALPNHQPFDGLMAAWYGDSGKFGMLKPASWLFGAIGRHRRQAYQRGRKRAWRAPVPVIVVGNITVGGTGKTPMVIWLARELKALGYQPGIVSRGHGGKRTVEPLAVNGDTDPSLAGDEAPMLAHRSGCRVVVCKDRVAAAVRLLDGGCCDMIISDDGLQHYSLARDIEIIVLDGQRAVGNGRLLPSGPLREPADRLAEVDWVISTGKQTDLAVPQTVMRIEPVSFVRIKPVGEPVQRVSVTEFTARHRQCHAVAGIGNPERFESTLRDIGLAPALRAYPDHHRYRGTEVEFDDDWPVVCTEKDAIKLRRCEHLPVEGWYLEIDVDLGEGAAGHLQSLLAKLRQSHS